MGLNMLRDRKSNDNLEESQNSGDCCLWQLGGGMARGAVTFLMVNKKKYRNIYSEKQ